MPTTKQDTADPSQRWSSVKPSGCFPFMLFERPAIAVLVALVSQAETLTNHVTRHG